MLYTDTERMEVIRRELRRPREGTRAAVRAAWLLWQAEDAAARPLACLTDTPSPAETGNPHDFFSEGPYWWPDPNNPGGAYIRRDGRVNPDRFTAHDLALSAVCRDAQFLALAGCHLERPAFYLEAKRRLRAFFLDPATRMNPNLQCAQAIRGICGGRGIGIIDAVCLHRALFALDLMESDGAGDAVTDRMRVWFGDFLTWLRTSKNGLDEKHHGNNHSMWYTALTMAISRFLGDGAGFSDDCAYFGEMMARQLSEEGAFLDELTRTNSLGYCCYNLNAAALICELAHFGGIDLWNASYGEGRSMRAAAAFLIPYLRNPYSWKWKQINGAVPEAHYALHAASLRLGISDAAPLLRAADPTKNLTPLGPIWLF